MLAFVSEAAEQKSLVKVVTDLRQRFPHVPIDVIETFVADAYLEFTGAPVRDYIPVMVQRVAKNRIAAIVDTPAD